MHVLTVDDWHSRHDLIRNTLSIGGVRVRALAERYSPDEVTREDIARADVIFLDHDMCQTRRTPVGLHLASPGDCPNPLQSPSSWNALNKWCGCPTGTDLALRIAEMYQEDNAPRSNPVVVVHTQNPTGAKRIRTALRRAGIEPIIAPAPHMQRGDPRELCKQWGLVG